MSVNEGSTVVVYFIDCIHMYVISIVHVSWSVEVCCLNMQVMFPVISSDTKSWRWPHVVSEDVTKHTGYFRGHVLVISGEVKQRTLLPFTPQATVVIDEVHDT